MNIKSALRISNGVLEWKNGVIKKDQCNASRKIYSTFLEALHFHAPLEFHCSHEKTVN